MPVVSTSRTTFAEALASIDSSQHADVNATSHVSCEGMDGATASAEQNIDVLDGAV